MIWVCSSSEWHEGSGQVGVSRRVWVRVKVVNSSGVRVVKACCHMARREFSGVEFGREVVCGGEIVVVVWVGA